MLGVPIGLEIGIDLAVDDKHAGSAFGDPGLDGIEIGKCADRRATRAKAAGDRCEIGFGKPDDVDRIALPPEVVDFGGIGAVVVDQDAEAKPQSYRGFQVCHRHQETAIAGAEHGKLAWIGHGEPDR